MITSYFTDTVTVTSPAALNEWGEPTGAATVRTVGARVEYGAREVRDQAGQIVVSSARILMSVDETLTFADKLTLEDGRLRPVIAMNRHTDLTARYLEVHVG